MSNEKKRREERHHIYIENIYEKRLFSSGRREILFYSISDKNTLITSILILMHLLSRTKKDLKKNNVL